MRAFPLVTLRRFEHIDNLTFSANSVVNLGTGGILVDPRWMWGLHLTFEGRITMPASGGPTALSADGIPQLIEQITVEGYHRVRVRNEKFFDLRGADAKFLTDYWTLGALPSAPATFNFAANATNDFRVHILVPFVPMGVHPLEQANYLLDTPNYDQLKVSIRCGDVASAFGSYSTAPALSAYGSASGSPRIRVAGYWALAGAARFGNRVPGKVFRYFQEVTGSTMTTTAPNVRIVDIPRGNFIRAIVMKTGVKSTTVTAGNSAYASLSDSILSEIKINRGLNRPVRYYPIQEQIRSEGVIASGYAGKAGYNVVDFSPNGVLGEAFDARALVAGSTGQTDLYVAADVTGAANQAALFVWEEIQQLPYAPARR